MLKKAILSLGVALGLGFGAHAQKCGTDEVVKLLKQRFPQMAIDEAALNEAMKAGQMHAIAGAANKGTGVDDFDTNKVYDIPLVFHIVHNYGNEYVSDDAIYNEVAYINQAYSRSNTSDLASLIPSYTGNIPSTSIRYVGNAKIRFHLATIDPNGNPTNGITRRYSYLSINGGDEAKFDIWPTNRYVNMWIINRMSGAHASAAAYAYPPFSAQQQPYGDGVIGLYNYLNGNHTFAHELGHIFNLEHVWGNTNSPEVACGDDGVDDTPPTKGHLVDNRIGGCDYPQTNPLADINDTTCAQGYSKVYTRSQYRELFGDSTLRPFIKFNTVTQRNDTFTNVTIDYPDTTNAQNIMDYTYCSKMFTYGQVHRMRQAMFTTLGGRNNLWTDSNLIRTGALAPRPDLTPIADFSVSRNFVCANTATTPPYQLVFTDRSWRDTIASRSWTISNGSPSTGNTATVLVPTITQPGWVTTDLTVSGNHTGSNTITRSDLVYAADPNAISPAGYYEDFDQSANSDVSMYPIFNYYKLNDYKWELSQYGAYDNTGIMFHNFDTRLQAGAETITRTPGGNFADFYTRAFNLTGFGTGACNLTFFSSGAYRVVNPTEMNDTLQISYSTDCGATWKIVGNLTQANLANKGLISSAYYPTGIGDWKLNGMTIPTLARTSKTFFRFRFLSGTDNGDISGYPFGTGNNFFLDRLNITSNAVGVNGAELEAKGMTIYPNPTNGSATVTLKGGDNSLAQIIVTDVTGKVVYRTEGRLTAADTQIEIPANAIAVKGMYMVQAVTNGKTQTQKLVVY